MVHLDGLYAGIRGFRHPRLPSRPPDNTVEPSALTRNSGCHLDTSVLWGRPASSPLAGAESAGIMRPSLLPSVVAAPPHPLAAARAVAERFALPGPMAQLEPLGQGNVNSTYLVTLAGAEPLRFVLQRLNTRVFPHPDRVMGNIARVSEHLAGSDAARSAGWRVPRLMPACHNQQPWLVDDAGQPWRLMTYLEECHCPQTIATVDEAREVARGLASFLRYLHDLPVDQLADTLEGFHVTPRYLQAFEGVLQHMKRPLDQHEQEAVTFVQARAATASVLEDARRRGELQDRPIHGDPKVNNVLLCRHSGRAVALIDLDTVKPGLLHYDIGDCLRSACNPLGEETDDLDGVVCDLERLEAMLEVLLSELRPVLTAADHAYLFDAIRLLPYELGLRFLTDHLAGDRYFRTERPGQNLQRALVQLRLSASIEAQEPAIRTLLKELA